MNCFKIENLSFRYSKENILSDINLNIDLGENIGLLGPNGSGKTTLLKILDHVLKPQNGKIILYNVDIQKYKRNEIARLIAYVPQMIEVIFPFTVMEFVLMGRSPYLKGIGFEKKEDINKAIECMELTKVIDLKNKPVTSISGGERQRALIARALCQEPKIILLDEPNAHLDIANQLELFSLIRRINLENQVNIISVCHDLNLAALYFDRILLLKNGRIMHDGIPKDVFTEENIYSIFKTKVEIDNFYKELKPRITILPD